MKLCKGLFPTACVLAMLVQHMPDIQNLTMTQPHTSTALMLASTGLPTPFLTSVQAAPVATTSHSKVTTPVMQPRYTIASCMVGNATSQVIAALVLRMQLVISRTIDNTSTMATPVTVLLHDGEVLPGALNLLRALVGRCDSFRLLYVCPRLCTSCLRCMQRPGR